jgi:hypothetical protein
MTAQDLPFIAISLGAGVQSTTLALLAEEGALPRPDVAIFADTGWEPAAVYEHLDRLEAAVSFPVLRVSAGNLRDDAINPAHRYASVPYFVRNPDGSEGMGRRQCTSEYKLSPIRRKIRELLGAAPPDFRRVPGGRVCEQWVGFSTDEVGRANRQKDSDGVFYLTTRYPLLDLGMSRADCERWLRAHGWQSTAKSACIGCPFHGNAQWRQLRDTCGCGHQRTEHFELYGGGHGACQVSNPANEHGHYLCSCEQFIAPEWADAVAFDAAIRKGGARGLPLNGEAFLHRSRLPLAIAPIDRVTRREWANAQIDIFDVVADQLLEDGDADGCSPYGCRSGAPVEEQP